MLMVLIVFKVFSKFLFLVMELVFGLNGIICNFNCCLVILKFVCVWVLFLKNKFIVNVGCDSCIVFLFLKVWVNFK